MMNLEDGLERALRLLRQPEFRELAENVDTIIVFKDGLFAGNIRGRDVLEDGTKTGREHLQSYGLIRTEKDEKNKSGVVKA